MADVNFDASPTVAASAVATLSVIGVALIAASPITAASASASLTGGNVSLQGSATTTTSATATLGGGNQLLQGMAKTDVAATAVLNGSAASLAASPIAAITATANLTGVSDTRGRTLCELIRESLSLWGFLCSKNAPGYALDRAITDINTALQLVWNNADGKDYWTQELVTITLNDGEDSYTLPDTVQNVVGPCRRSDNSRPLTPLRTIGELETFVDLYLNGETTDEPLAYHIERLKQSVTDPAKCIFRVVPAVSGAAVSLLLEVVKECPRYTVADLATCPLVPIPHQYAETLLIPIIRYNASSYYLFTAGDATQKETIDREYQQARISLGLADPNPAKGEMKGGEA